MDRGMLNVSMRRGQLSTPNTTVHLVTAQPMFPSDSRHDSENLLIEYRKSPGIFNRDRPSLATVKNITNFGIAHPTIERNQDALMAAQL